MIKLAFDLPWNNEQQHYKDSASVVCKSSTKEGSSDTTVTMKENITTLLTNLVGEVAHNQNHSIVNEKLTEKLIQINTLAQTIADNYPFFAKFDTSSSDDYGENVVATVKIMKACKHVDGLVNSIVTEITTVLLKEKSEYGSDGVLVKTLLFACYYIKAVGFYKLQNWKDMIQTTNRIIQLFQPSTARYIDEKNTSSNSTSSNAINNPSVFFPLGLSDLMLLNSEAHKSLGNMGESLWSIRLAVQIAERKYEEYNNDNNHANNSNNSSNNRSDQQNATDYQLSNSDSFLTYVAPVLLAPHAALITSYLAQSQTTATSPTTNTPSPAGKNTDAVEQEQLKRACIYKAIRVINQLTEEEQDSFTFMLEQTQYSSWNSDNNNKDNENNSSINSGKNRNQIQSSSSSSSSSANAKNKFADDNVTHTSNEDESQHLNHKHHHQRKKKQLKKSPSKENKTFELICDEGMVLGTVNMTSTNTNKSAANHSHPQPSSSPSSSSLHPPQQQRPHSASNNNNKNSRPSSASTTAALVVAHKSPSQTSVLSSRNHNINNHANNSNNDDSADILTAKKSKSAEKLKKAVNNARVLAAAVALISSTTAATKKEKESVENDSNNIKGKNRRIKRGNNDNADDSHRNKSSSKKMHTENDENDVELFSPLNSRSNSSKNKNINNITDNASSVENFIHDTGGAEVDNFEMVNSIYERVETNSNGNNSYNNNDNDNGESIIDTLNSLESKHFLKEKTATASSSPKPLSKSMSRRRVTSGTTDKKPSSASTAIAANTVGEHRPKSAATITTTNTSTSTTATTIVHHRPISTESNLSRPISSSSSSSTSNNNNNRRNKSSNNSSNYNNNIHSNASSSTDLLNFSPSPSSLTHTQPSNNNHINNNSSIKSNINNTNTYIIDSVLHYEVGQHVECRRMHTRSSLRNRWLPGVIVLRRSTTAAAGSLPHQQQQFLYDIQLDDSGVIDYYVKPEFIRCITTTVITNNSTNNNNNNSMSASTTSLHGSSSSQSINEARRQYNSYNNYDSSDKFEKDIATTTSIRRNNNISSNNKRLYSSAKHTNIKLSLIDAAIMIQSFYRGWAIRHSTVPFLQQIKICRESYSTHSRSSQTSKFLLVSPYRCNNNNNNNNNKKKKNQSSQSLSSKVRPVQHVLASRKLSEKNKYRSDDNSGDNQDSGYDEYRCKQKNEQEFKNSYESEEKSSSNNNNNRHNKLYNNDRNNNTSIKMIDNEVKKSSSSSSSSSSSFVNQHNQSIRSNSNSRHNSPKNTIINNDDDYESVSIRQNSRRKRNNGYGDESKNNNGYDYDYDYGDDTIVQNGDYHNDNSYDNHTTRNINSNKYRDNSHDREYSSDSYNNENERRINNNHNNGNRYSDVKESDNVWTREDNNSKNQNNQNFTNNMDSLPTSNPTSEVVNQKQKQQQRQSSSLSPLPLSPHEQIRIEKEVRSRALNDIMSMLNVKIHYHTQLLSDIRIEEDLYRKEKDLQLAQAQYEEQLSFSSATAVAVMPEIAEGVVVNNNNSNNNNNNSENTSVKNAISSTKGTSIIANDLTNSISSPIVAPGAFTALLGTDIIAPVVSLRTKSTL